MEAIDLFHYSSCFSCVVVGYWTRFRLDGYSYRPLHLGSPMGHHRHSLHRGLGLLSTATSVHNIGLRQAANINCHRLSHWDTHISNHAHKTIHVGELDMEKQPRKWYWIATLILLSISLYTAWYLQLNPQHIPLFLTTTIIAIGFVVVMALLPKYRQRLVNGILEYDAKGKERGGWLYRYQKVAVAAIAMMALIFPIATKLLASQYIPYFVLALVIVNLVAGSVLIGGLVRV